MSVGQGILIIVTILVAAGACQRVLDKLRLTDRQALLFAGLILLGGLVPNIAISRFVRVNLGGAVVPLVLAIYVWTKADTGRERLRALIATLLTAGAVFALGRFFPDEPDTMPFDVNYLYGLAGGLIAYVLGRSRRGAFVAGVAGMLVADIAQAVLLWRGGVSQTLFLGGAGLMDTIVISGVLAVLTAELVGEFRERLTRGAERRRAE